MGFWFVVRLWNVVPWGFVWWVWNSHVGCILVVNLPVWETCYWGFRTMFLGLIFVATWLSLLVLVELILVWKPKAYLIGLLIFDLGLHLFIFLVFFSLFRLAADYCNAAYVLSLLWFLSWSIVTPSEVLGQWLLHSVITYMPLRFFGFFGFPPWRISCHMAALFWHYLLWMAGFVILPWPANWQHCYSTC